MAAILLAGACGAEPSAEPDRPAASAQAAPPATTAPPEASSEGNDLPPPDAPIPTRPAPLAEALARVTQELRASIDAWIAEGNVSALPPPRDVVLRALYQQRIYRTLASHERLRRATIAHVPRWLEGEARANATAGAKLFSLVSPLGRPATFWVGRPRPAGELLDHYRSAERRFGVDWEVLAAVNYIESNFGRARSASSAGAQGPMQFIPSTWDAYGLRGNIRDPRDAVMGAANYLHASGAPQHYRRALYAYNHSWTYVDAVLLYARRMMRDPRAYFAYYNWQVFVLTTSGERRLTGPGL